jgi:hypothetical protein
MTRQEMLAHAKEAGELGDQDLELKILEQVAAMPQEKTVEQFGKNLVADLPKVGQPFVDLAEQFVKHPVDTMGNVAGAIIKPPIGALQLAGTRLTGEQDAPFGLDFRENAKQAYGPMWEDTKHPIESFYEHPGTTLVNVSGLVNALSAGAKPVINALRGPVSSAGGQIANVIGEYGTHTGGETVRDMARAGLEGGEKKAQAIRFLNGDAPLEEIVANARTGLAGLKKADSAAYTTAMAPLLADTTVLDYQPIVNAVRGVTNSGINVHGHVENPSSVMMANKLAPIFKEWSGQPYVQNAIPQPAYPASQAHTLAGLDSLKKRVYQEYKKAPIGSPERDVGKQAYKAVRGTLGEQVPAYGDVMEMSQNAIKRRKGLEKELSLTENAHDGTTLRKVLSIPRNNANTNYGNRVEMAKLLEENGANNLMTQLNAAALNSYKPRGLGGLTGTGTVGGLAFALTGGNPAVAATTAALLAAQSPKLMGKAAMATGTTARRAERFLSTPNTKRAIAAAALAQILNGDNNE